MLKSIYGVLATALFAVALAAPAGASDADVARQFKDRAEIQDLMWKYVRALDSYNAEAYASVFTADGQFGSGQNAVKGTEALKKMVADLKKGRDDREAKGEKQAPMYHVIANSSIEFVGKDQARFYSYWMTVFAANGPNTTPRVAAAGRGVDELVRQDGKWLIKSRDVAPTN